MSAPVASLFAFAVALGVTRLGLRWLSARAGRFGLLDRAGGRKQHQGSVPLVGGTALLIGVLAGGGVGLALAGDWPAECAAVAVALVGMYLVGLADDAMGKTMTAAAKTAWTLLLLAVVAVWLGRTGSWVGLPVAFLVVHAFNTSDNMNGLSGGLGWVGVLGLWLAAALGLVDGALAGPSAAWSGALLAFLCLNYPRGRVFLGDSGSLLLGGWFAAAWMTQAHPALLCFLVVPLADLLTVAWLRVRSHQLPWVADRRHLSHRLARDHGWGEPRTVLALVVVQVACNALGLLLLAKTSGHAPVSWAVATVALLLACGAALSVRELPWSRGPADRPASEPG